MALAVHAAQLNALAQLRKMLFATLFLALVFAGLISFEHGYLAQQGFSPGNRFDGIGLLSEQQQQQVTHTFRFRDPKEREKVFFRFAPHYRIDSKAIASSLAAANMPAALVRQHSTGLKVTKESLIAWKSYNGANNTLSTWGATAAVNTFSVHFKDKPHIFFGFFYAMTTLHLLHVIAGIFVLVWVFKKAGGRFFPRQGSTATDFGPAYYTPLTNVGLYWHFVTLIWILLFPLLYLVK